MNKLTRAFLLLLVGTLSTALAIRPEMAQEDHWNEEHPLLSRHDLNKGHLLSKLEKFNIDHLLESGEALTASHINLNGSAQEKVVERLNKKLRAIEGEVRVTQVQKDEMGNQHIRLLQYYKGIPIIGSDMVVHVDAKNRVYATGGNKGQAMAFATVAKFSHDSAEGSVRQGLHIDKTIHSTEIPKLVIYDGKLAYEVTMPGSKPDIWKCYVDANTGEVLYRVNRVLHAAPVGGAQTVVHGNILADEGGTDQNVNGWLDTQNRYFLYHTTNLWGVYDEDAADWEQQSTPNWFNNDRAAMSLGRNLAITQDYVKTVLNRNSYNNSGAFAEGIVHVGTNYANAYWDGSVLNFGDGDGVTANPLTSLDVVAHEYGHAITENTSNLVYSDEPGALNESYSDIMGTLVEFYGQPDGRSSYPAGVNGQADYLIGEDCWINGEALRDMRNPLRYQQPSYYGGTNWVPGADVHTNSGVQNFAFYLLAEGGNGSNDGHAYNITGVGVQVAGKIALYANMYLLTSNSQYRDARDAWVLAATTLGYNAATVSAVWAACGIAPLESHLAANPTSIDFGNSGVGSVNTLSVVLSNNGSSPTNVIQILFTDPKFSTSAALPISVPSGGTFTLPISYSPTALTTDVGTLALVSNAIDNPRLAIPLRGIGSPPPRASVTPTSIAISISPLDAPADRTATLSNSGEANLTYTISINAANSPASAMTTPSLVSELSVPRTELMYASENYSYAFTPAQVIVAFKVGQNGFASQGVASLAQSITELAIAKNPSTHKRSHTGRKMVLIKLPESNAPSVTEAIQIFLSDANVEYAEPNFVRKLVAIPNDPGFTNLYGMHNVGQSGGTVDADIDAPEAWDRFTGNKNIVLGLIDSGIDYLHPDLAGNIWLNQSELNGVPGVDDDGNGYVDDIRGYDFINVDSDPYDDLGHGTHCAGTIAGIGNNGIGVAGVAWTANVAALKIFNSAGSTTDAAILNAVDYSNAMDMKITSNSWGGGAYSQSLFDLINEARNLGHLFIAAAGNNGSNTDLSPNYPSGYELDNIISVAATDRFDGLASFSNYGALSVDLGAPGVDVYSCYPGGTYTLMSGTSMATPHTSGAAYLIWSYNPFLSAAAVKRALLTNTDLTPSLTGRTVTGGRLNVAKALAAAGPNWLRVTPLTGTVAASQSAPLTVTVNPTGLQAGRWTGDVNILTNDPANPTLRVQVTATVSSCHNVSITPASLDFGSVLIGSSTTRDLAIENRCNESTVISALSTNNSAYRFSSVLPITLPAFRRTTLSVSFNPLSARSEAGALTVTSDDDVNPVQRLTLTGAGALGPILRVPVNSISGRANPGTKISRTLSIFNDGGLPLNWTLSGLGAAAVSTTTVYGSEHYQELEKDQMDTRIGQPVLSVRGGPDDFGYRWIDSDEADGPRYVWNDIGTTGTLLTTVSRCDDCYENHSLSFPFSFYGVTYNDVFIGSNGYLTFGAGSSGYTNYPLPSPSAPSNLVAGFFDDLLPSSGIGVYFQDFGDRIIVQYEHVPHYQGTGNYTFQIELKKDGTITYYYKSLTGVLNENTVGLQNAGGTVGLTTVYNQTYLKEAFAVRYGQNPSWIYASNTSGTIPAGGNSIVNVTLDATGLRLGDYTTNLLLNHNDLNQQNPREIPVMFSVTNSLSVHSRILRVGPSAQPKVTGTTHSLAQAYNWGKCDGFTTK